MISLRQFRSSSGTTGWTSLCVRPDRVDMARMRAGSGDAKPALEMFESFAVGKDPLLALKRLRKQFNLHKQRCTTLLEPADYQLIQMETPAVDGDERMEVIRERLADMIETPMAHVTVDAFDIPTEALGPGRPKNSYAVVAGNAAVAPKIQMFHKAGIKLGTIDIPEMAQRNLARCCEQVNRATAFLAFDDIGGLLTFSANGDLFMFRRIDLSLKAILTDDMDRRSTLYDRIGLEVQRSLDNYDRQYGGFLPLSKLVIGPQPEATPMQGFLKDYLGIAIDSVGLDDLIDISAVPELRDPGRQSQALQAIGAAMRDEGAA